VDPFFAITHELRCDLHLVRTTSDEFFARRHPLAHFRKPVFDLAFIDGMHLSEYALRDFINSERHTHPGSVIVIDDVLPRNVREASRDHVRGPWAGDVFKIIDVLRQHRPDLVVLEVDTQPTGTLVVLLPDAHDRRLMHAYDEVVPELVVPDPQVVPEWSLTRSRAIHPHRLLGAPIWTAIRSARRRDPSAAREHVFTALDHAGLTTAVR
jgi:hypothetical protein